MWSRTKLIMINQPLCSAQARRALVCWKGARLFIIPPLAFVAACIRGRREPSLNSTSLERFRQSRVSFCGALVLANNLKLE